MATLLYRLGRFSFRRRRMVAAVWVLVLAALAAGALTLGGRTVDTFTIPGTESQRALDDLRRDLPAAAGAALTVVVSAPTGQALDSATMKAAVSVVVRRAASLPDVVAATDPVQVDRTGRVGLLSVQYAKSDSELTAADRDAFATLATAGTNGLEVVPGGVSGGPPEIGARAAIGVLIAAVVLLYALFLGSRHRAQLAEGMEVEESAARATATAGSAVLFAGATVVIALAALSLAGVPFLTAMALAAAGTVLTAVLVALTLLPALLGFAGLRVLPRSQRRRGAHVRPGFGFRWARCVVRFRRSVLVVLVLGLGALSLPALDLRLALPDNGTAPAGSRQRTAYDLITAAFGPGANGPLLVVVRGPRGDTVSALASRVTADVRKLQNVTAAGPGPANAGGTTRVVIVTPGTGPTSQETADLIREIRATVAPLTGADDSVAVTGATAVGVDVSRTMTAALPEYLGVVIGLSFLLLLLAFRSLLVPLKATAGFLLTMGATFGLTAGVFQHGWAAGLFGVDRPGPLVSFLPIIMLSVLFGLTMDYEVFIVSRVREEFTHGSDATEATIAGVGHGAPVVTAAALIMAAVFGGFVLIEDPAIKTIGFGLALGVLMDAFLVRMTLVPAVLTLLGHRAWAFPRWLDRITPRVDIEGEGLRPPGPAPRHAAPEPELVRARGR
ncbi:MMPL family transporter [Winogradskya humida]|uniref:Membrane protein n=1 Tax=Winogradskya humida TaxID=113566 RepID=A0ABQ3ZVR7_9ACTN|nr:MMPL family transporter [Actinoplanes humidus]GIE22690.1 membrane protein [Actinoplanes humidus]